MIKTLDINNIQSHENTKLDFVNGVNVIIGGSNQGKSAILRAFYWLVYNRPVGTSTLASHWIVNDKGNLRGNMSVSVSNDNGGVVCRYRDKDVNQYIVNDETLNVVKTDVPEQVSKALKLSQTNIQKQMDAPFLLSETSGEVAKYFNSIVNLNVIDRVLTNAESKRKKIKAESEHIKIDIDALETNLENYIWLDGVAPLFAEIDDLLVKLNQLNADIDSLENESSKVDQLLSIIERMSVVAGANEILADVAATETKLENISSNVYKLEKSISEVESFKIYDFSKQKNWIDKMENISVDEESITTLSNSIRNYELQSDYLIAQNRVIEENKALLPKTCPVCGGVLKESCL